MRNADKRQQVVGAVAIYGTHRCGHGWIADAGQGRLYGDGEVRADRGATTALWQACEKLRDVLGTVGRVAVTIDTDAGPFVAYTSLQHPDTFGALKWERNNAVLTVSADAIMAAAE